MILLIGHGYWGRNLARNFQKELVAVCDSDLDRLQACQQQYPAVTMYQDLDDALSHPGLTAALIATKAASHHDIAARCLEAKLDLWIEKPVCHSLDAIDDLIAKAKQHDRIIMVDHTFCYNPAVEHIQQIDIGQPKYYDSCRISLGLFQSDVDALLDLAVHDVSIIDYLWPDLELQSRDIIKNCHVNNQANQVIVNLRFTSGFTATINCNWVSPVKKRQIIITGDRNSVVYDDIDIDKIKIYSTGQINTDYNANQLGDMIAPKIATTEALAVARSHFLHCVRTRTEPRTSIQRTRKIMGWLL